MATTPYPLPKSTRQSAVLLGDGSTTYGPFGDGWGIFDLDDVLVETRPVAAGVFLEAAATIAKVNPAAAYGTFNVIFPAAITSATEFRVTGSRTHERELAVTRGGAIDGVALEKELSKQSVVLQELRRDVSDQAPPADRASSIIGYDSHGASISYAISQLLSGAFDARGPFAGRAAYNAQAAGFTYLDTDSRPLVFYIRDTAVAGVWGGPFYFGLAPATGLGFDYPTRADASAATIPAVVTSINVLGHTTAGLGGARYKEVADAGTLEAWQFRSNGATRRWQLNEPLVTPFMLGAAGDGAADDTLAIQAAINFSYAVHFPAGTYIAGRLTLKTGSKLTGAGVDVAIIKHKAAANDYGLYMTGVSDVFVSNLTLDGNSANNLTAGMGVRVEGASFDLLFDNVRATNWRFDGFGIGSTGSRLQFQNCQADANLRDGYSFTSTTRVSVADSLAKGNTRFGIVFGAGCNQSRADSNLCVDNSDTNIIAVNCTDIVFDGNVASGSLAAHGLQFNTVTRGVMSANSTYGNVLSGLDVYASTYCTVTGNNSYLNTVRGIEVDSASFYTTVVGNIVYRNGEVGVSVFRSPNTSIIGNHIVENGTAASPKYGIRLWDTAGTLASANCRIIGNNISDDRGGSATQTHALSLEDSATGLTLIGNNLTPNVTAAVNLASGSIAFAEGNLGYSKAPTVLTLLNSWVAYDAAWEAPQSYLDASGIVQVTGVMKNGTITAGTVIATLPVGQRPAKVAGPFIVYADTAGFAALYVLTNGDITAQSALVAARTSLCGITFKAA